MTTLSRRAFLSLGCAALSPWSPAAALSVGVRRYRADAVITFLGLSIFSRSGVGSGYSFHDRREGGVTVYGFAGGSWPERARGLNRLGYFREESGETAGRRWTNYTGVMTTSHEERLEEARESLETREGESSFTAIRGTVSAQRALCRKAHFVAKQTIRWPDCRELMSTALSELDKEDGQGASSAAEARTMSFLHAVAETTRHGERELTQTVAYNDVQYRLKSKTERDEKMGRRLCELGAAAEPSRIRKVSAQLSRIAGSKGTSEFKFWFEEGSNSALPLRIEHKARSFLRLVFEVDPTVEHEAMIELPPARGS